MKNFSIIIPVYNRPRLLEEALESINFVDNLEVIVVDDASKKENAKSQKKISEKYGCKYLLSGTNNGVAESRNIGVNNSIGAYIYFLDSDDLLTDDMNFFIKNFEVPKKEIIYRTWYKNLGAKGKVRTFSIGKKLKAKDKYYSISASTCIFPRKVFADTTFVGRFMEDEIYFAKIIQKYDFKEMELLKIYSFYYRKNYGGETILSAAVRSDQVVDFIKSSNTINSEVHRHFAQAKMIRHLIKSNALKKFEDEISVIYKEIYLNRKKLFAFSPVYYKYAYKKIFRKKNNLFTER